MNPRGSPNKSSGRTGTPSTTSVNSASRPTAACASTSGADAEYLSDAFIAVPLRCAPGHDRHISDIDVQVIVGRGDGVAGRTDARERQNSPCDNAVSIDPLRR